MVVFNMVVFSMVVFSMVVFNIVVFNMVVFSMVVFSMVVFSMVVFSMVVFSMVVFNMVVFNMVVFNMVVFNMVVFKVFQCIYTWVFYTVFRILCSIYCCCRLPTPLTLASGGVRSSRLWSIIQLFRSSDQQFCTTAGSVHKSRGNNVVCMWV